MKDLSEKPKMVTETIDIGMSVGSNTVLITTKEGGSMKEPYEPPKMVIETVDDSNQDRYYWVIPR